MRVWLPYCAKTACKWRKIFTTKFRSVPCRIIEPGLIRKWQDFGYFRVFLKAWSLRDFTAAFLPLADGFLDFLPSTDSSCQVCAYFVEIIFFVRNYSHSDLPSKISDAHKSVDVTEFSPKLSEISLSVSNYPTGKNLAVGDDVLIIPLYRVLLIYCTVYKFLTNGNDISIAYWRRRFVGW